MIKSTRYCTGNEDEEEEISIVRTATLVESLKNMWKTRSFQRPSTITETYVACRTRWVDKATGVAPDNEKQFELFEIKGYHKREIERIDFGLKD